MKIGRIYAKKNAIPNMEIASLDDFSYSFRIRLFPDLKIEDENAVLQKSITAEGLCNIALKTEICCSKEDEIKFLLECIVFCIKEKQDTIAIVFS